MELTICGLVISANTGAEIAAIKTNDKRSALMNRIVSCIIKAMRKLFIICGTFHVQR
jgi:hypothetical protein